MFRTVILAPTSSFGIFWGLLQCLHTHRSHSAHLDGKSKVTIVFIVVLQRLIDSKRSHHHPVDCLNENLRSTCSMRTKQGTNMHKWEILHLLLLSPFNDCAVCSPPTLATSMPWWKVHCHAINLPVLFCITLQWSTHCTEKIAAGTASIKLSSLGSVQRGSTDMHRSRVLHSVGIGWPVEHKSTVQPKQHTDNEGNTGCCQNFGTWRVRSIPQSLLSTFSSLHPVWQCQHIKQSLKRRFPSERPGLNNNA